MHRQIPNDNATASRDNTPNAGSCIYGRLSPMIRRVRVAIAPKSTAARRKVIEPP
jgi:hypothetical protein